MKYPKLTSLVPAAEHFDETAITGEGVWLTTGHVDALESTIVAKETAISTLETAATDFATEKETLTADLSTAQNAVSENATTIATQAARIAELESENAVLSKKPSGAGTTLITGKDPSEETTETPSYLDDKSPENAWFDKQTKFR